MHGSARRLRTVDGEVRPVDASLGHDVMTRVMPAATAAAATIAEMHDLNAGALCLLLRAVQRNAVVTVFVARFAVLQLIGAALLLAAWAEGLLYRPYAADSSGMCWLITLLFGWGLFRVLRRDWGSVRWVGNTLVYLSISAWSAPSSASSSPSATSRPTKARASRTSRRS
jgi:hypothetical protein